MLIVTGGGVGAQVASGGVSNPSPCAGGPHGGYHGHYHDEGYGPPPPHYEGRRMGPPVGGHRRGPSRYGPQYGHPPPPPPPPEYGPHADSPVLMVYGLDQSKMNCDRVFNIFCLYGNVEKVKSGGLPGVGGGIGGASPRGSPFHPCSFSRSSS